MMNVRKKGGREDGKGRERKGRHRDTEGNEKRKRPNEREWERQNEREREREREGERGKRRGVCVRSFGYRSLPRGDHVLVSLESDAYGPLEFVCGDGAGGGVNESARLFASEAAAHPLDLTCNARGGQPQHVCGPLLQGRQGDREENKRERLID